MNIYSVVFTMRHETTAVIEQPALSAVDAIARVHVRYGHMNRNATYSVAHGRSAMTVSAARDGGIAAAVTRHWHMMADRRPAVVIAGYRAGGAL